MTKKELIQELEKMQKDINNLSLQTPDKNVGNPDFHQLKLVETQQMLEHSRDRYADLYDFAPIGYITLDRGGIIKEANLTAAGMLERSRLSIIGKPLASFIVKTDINKFYQHLVKLKEGSIKETLEIRLNSKYDPRFCHFETIPVVDYQSNDLSFRTVLSDITERRELEQQMVYKEGQLSAIFNQVIVGIVQVDLEGNLLMVNKKFSEITGRTKEELLQLNLKDITYSKDIEHKTELLKSLTPANPFRTYQKRYVKPDGTIVWVHNSITLISDNLGNYKYAVSLVEDISERIKIEENLQKSLKELSDYKYALDESSIVAITDQSGVIKYANDNFCRISKYSREELLGQDHRIVNSEFHSKEFIKDIWNTIAKGQIWKGEIRNQAKDGSIYWVDTTIVPFLNEKNKPYQYVAIRSDITERKLGEEKIRESEERFKMMADTTPALIWMTGSDGVINYMNKTRVEFCGGTIEDQLGDNWQQFVHPDDLETVVALGREANDTRKSFQIEYRLRCNDGEYRWILDTGLPRFRSNGAFAGFIGSGIDITDIKEAQTKLSESYEREKNLRIKTEEGEQKLAFLAEATSILNSSLDYNLTLKSLAHMSTPEIADWCVVDLLDEQSKELRRVAVSHIEPDKVKYAYEVSKNYMPEESEATGVWNVLRTGKSELYKEISEDMVREGANNEEHLKIMLELGPESVMIVPLKIHDKVFGAISFIYAKSGRHYDEEDLHFVEDLASRAALAIDNARLYRESRLLNEKLEERVKELQFEIEARIKARKELVASEERFRQLAENIKSVFYIVNHKKREVVYLSPAFEAVWGISPDEVYERPARWLDLIHPEDRIRMREKIFAQQGLEDLNDEFRIVRPDGNERWIHTKSFPVKNESGEVYRIVGISEDITKRKKSEDQIKQSLKEKEVLLREIHHRVKNNLQIISSLLSLQTSSIKNQEDLEIFIDSQNRVRSMALVHEKLYQRKDLSGINMEEYVKELTSILRQTYWVKAELIDFIIDVDKILLNIDMSIGLGLIINELVSNTFKHAFPDDRRGEVSISVKMDKNNTLNVKIADNGVGIPESIDIKNTESLGLQLVTTLVEQHWGTINLHRNHGTIFELSFPEIKLS